jgi:hypothetical protein
MLQRIARACSALKEAGKCGKKVSHVFFGTRRQTSVEMECHLAPEDSAVALASMGTGSASPYFRASQRGRRRLDPSRTYR